MQQHLRLPLEVSLSSSIRAMSFLVSCRCFLDDLWVSASSTGNFARSTVACPLPHHVHFCAMLHTVLSHRLGHDQFPSDGFFTCIVMDAPLELDFAVLTCRRSHCVIRKHAVGLQATPPRADQEVPVLADSAPQALETLPFIRTPRLCRRQRQRFLGRQAAGLPKAVTAVHEKLSAAAQ